MAIDTESKRRSTLEVLPVPLGAISAESRRGVLEIYSGLPRVIVFLTLSVRSFAVNLATRSFDLATSARSFDLHLRRLR